MVLAELKDAQCKQSLTQLLHMIRMNMMESMNKESSYLWEWNSSSLALVITMIITIMSRHLWEEKAALFGESGQNDVEHLEQILAIPHLSFDLIYFNLIHLTSHWDDYPDGKYDYNYDYMSMMVNMMRSMMMKNNVWNFERLFTMVLKPQPSVLMEMKQRRFTIKMKVFPNIKSIILWNLLKEDILVCRSQTTFTAATKLLRDARLQLQHISTFNWILIFSANIFFVRLNYVTGANVKCSINSTWIISEWFWWNFVSRQLRKSSWGEYLRIRLQALHLIFTKGWQNIFLGIEIHKYADIYFLTNCSSKPDQIEMGRNQTDLLIEVKHPILRHNWTQFLCIWSSPRKSGFSWSSWPSWSRGVYYLGHHDPGVCIILEFCDFNMMTNERPVLCELLHILECLPGTGRTFSL